jgi:16S rRNA (guanine527-N7)-methyltransferase
MDLIRKYFPDLSDHSAEQLSMLWDLYQFWNRKINVVSRKDIDALYEHHVLHSLALLKVVGFKPETTILDVGTGGGFPGIPLAIMNPGIEFLLIDGISKKIRVVREVIQAIGLQNTQARPVRAENLQDQFHYIVCRAVTSLPRFYGYVHKNLIKQKEEDHYGIYCLKGGDLNDELNRFPEKFRVFNISDFFEEAFFKTKKIVFIPA